MASTNAYLQFLLEQLSGLKEIRHRAMMGEYILYYKEKVFGGIYDNRFLVKPVPAAIRLMPFAQREIPHPGAKEMLLVDQVDDPEFLRILIESMYNDLPDSGKKGKKL